MLAYSFLRRRAHRFWAPLDRARAPASMVPGAAPECSPPPSYGLFHSPAEEPVNEISMASAAFTQATTDFLKGDPLDSRVITLDRYRGRIESCGWPVAAYVSVGTGDRAASAIGL